MNEVITRVMSEQERQAYLKKYPIKANLSKRKVDYKWRGKKANKSRWEGAKGVTKL